MTTIKGKMDVRFPANIAVGNFLTVTKSNGTYTFGVDYTLLGPGPISDQTLAMIPVLDQAAGVYKIVSLSSLIDTVTPLPIARGGTAATTVPDARTSLGLGTMATQNANVVAITGGTIASATITGLPAPVASSDAARLLDVSNAAAGITYLPSCNLATAAVLPNTPTYANGTAGVGATLTAGSNSTLTVDGSVAALNAVVLVKNQASAFQNGIYTVTTAGSGAAAWVLTRATYYDTSAEMLAGTTTLILGGTINIGTGYTLQTTVATVGTTAANFNQSTSAGVVSIAGNQGVFTLGGILSNSANVLSVTATAKADQQTATSNVLAVTPLHQQDHPSSPKAWAYFSVSGSTYTNAASFGITGITRVSTGIVTVTLSTAFTSSSFAAIATANQGGLYVSETIGSRSASTVRLNLRTDAGVATDSGFSVMFFGTQA